ncbi:regulatory protein RecX [Chloroflexota bacterium]
MKNITALRVGRGRGKRVNVFLDGKFAFILDTGVVTREGLQIEQALSDEQIEALTRVDQFHRCLNAASHYLSYRPRSEHELKEKLRQRGFDDDTQEAVRIKLKEQGLVDDMAFAQFWKDNREAFSPRSRRLTGLELRRKGIANDIIDQVVNAVDDEDSAYRAAMSRMRSLPRSDYQGFRHRLSEYLKRRGFSYGVINHTVKRVCQDQTNSSSSQHFSLVQSQEVR